MIGLTALDELLASMAPELGEQEYVFATFPGAKYADLASFKPLASMLEKEGLTLVIERSVAQLSNVPIDSVFRKISLKVHSSLDAVGLTAAVSRILADQGIPANMIAGYYHDHIFVPAEKAEAALRALTKS